MPDGCLEEFDEDMATPYMISHTPLHIPHMILVLPHFFTSSFFVLFIQSAVLTQILRSWNRRVDEKEI